jgi:hypothetical protein
MKQIKAFVKIYFFNNFTIRVLIFCAMVVLSAMPNLAFCGIHYHMQEFTVNDTAFIHENGTHKKDNVTVECDFGVATISVLSGSPNDCSGVTLKVKEKWYRYQWKRNGVDIYGANDSLYKVTKPGYYSVYYVTGFYNGRPCMSSSGTIEVPMRFNYSNGLKLTSNQAMTINYNTGVFGDIEIESGTSLTINSNATLHMGQGSKIIVKNGGTLHVDNGNIQGECNQMWQGIEVLDGGILTMQNRNTISDAVEGIKINNASASIHNTIFDGNMVNIHLSNCWNTSNTFSGNQFNHLSPLKDQTLGTQINGIKYGTTSFKIEYSSVTIGADPNNPNVFNGGENGIDIFDAYVFTSQNTFKNIRRAAINGNGSTGFTQRTSTISNNAFKNCTNAVKLYNGIPATIVGNTIDSCLEHGIVWLNNTSCKLILGQGGTGLGNTINATRWGAICVYDNSGMNTDISISNNTIRNATYGTGIIINETNVSSSRTYKKLDIFNNVIAKEGDGIVLTNITGYGNFSNDTASIPEVSRICNNTIAFDTESGPYKCGMKISNTSGLNIFNNYVSTASNTDWRTTALRMSDCPNTFISNNTLEAGIGLLAQANMINTKIACNTFKNCVDGIQLNYCYLRVSGNAHGTGSYPLSNNFTNILPWGQAIELYNSDVAYNKWFFIKGTNPDVLLTGKCGWGSNKLFADSNATNTCNKAISGDSYKMAEADIADFSSPADVSLNDPVLNINHPIEGHFKQVYDILLNRDTATKKLNDAQTEAMATLAKLNPRKAGPAVYAARAILLSERHMYFIDDDENDGSQYNKHFQGRSTSISNGKGSEALLYPNPTIQGYATLDLNSDLDEVVLLELCDYTGKVVYSSNHLLKTGSQKIEINTSDLLKGLYILKISSLTKPLLVKKLTVN